ncbi:MAG: TetR/AcrR family transcriptional regulator [Candidatus Aminicenantes bacterium]|nr:TetR/AcrR family transcriptional regulator [Candidatus Aminicenantes bacterium]
MERKKLQREREEKRRQQFHHSILEAAERVIVRKGYNVMTMDDVAREAQLSKATLYHYFRSKGELTLEILGHFFEEINEEVQKISLLPLSAKERLKKGIRFYLQFHQEKENISRMLITDRSFIEKMKIFVTEEKKLTSDTDRRFITKMKTRRKDILDQVAGFLRDGVADGEFRKIDVSAAVTFLESLLQGYCHVRYWHERPYSVREATEIIHGFFLQGIQKREEGLAKGASR